MNRIPLDIDCKEIADEVKNLRECGKWQSRSYDFPFYTLGASAYLDGNTKKYYCGAKQLNPGMLYWFFKLYQEVSGQLSNYFDEWVLFNPSLALPGFHIFPSDNKLLTVAGNWHLDAPHTTLGIGDKDTYSFTVAIELPTGGGGMDMKIGGESNEYIEYQVGELVLHDGMTPHRIASYREYKPDEYRITLQGHIVRDGKDLITFW